MHMCILIFSRERRQQHYDQAAIDYSAKLPNRYTVSVDLAMLSSFWAT